MDRAIVGLRQDAEDDWIADLSCGHAQHVRHRPPFQDRPWVLDEDERASRTGTVLACPLCDRAELPQRLRLLRVSPAWDEQAMPAGLRHGHRLADGHWAVIAVQDGALDVSMALPSPLHRRLAAGESQAVPPGLEHSVRPAGRVRFSIDFLAAEHDSRHLGQKDELDQLDNLDHLDELGGEPACLLARLCPDCGGVIEGSEGHRPGCASAPG